MTQSNTAQANLGAAVSRVDGIKKVTGQAPYAGEHHVPDLLVGVIVSAAITRGRVAAIHTDEALEVEGIVDILTHQNRPNVPWYDVKHEGTASNDKPPFRALRDAEILFAGQPIALVVASSFEAAREAAMLVRVDYESASHNTDLVEALTHRYTPERKKKSNLKKGDVDAAIAVATATVSERYTLQMEHHQPMEMHTTTVQWHGDGNITVYDKNQGSQNAQEQLVEAFGWDPERLRVCNAYVGGAFGSGLRPGYQAYLAILAAIKLERSLRVTMTRQQMFTHVHRPACVQDIRLACDDSSKFTAIDLKSTTSTSRFETYTENINGWGPTAYPADNLRTDYAVAEIDTPTPGNMRAPGAATGMNLFEIAVDELAYAQGVDPYAFRLANYSTHHGISGKPYTSKALLRAYELGAERFAWDERLLAARSMRDGKELIGWGMATGIWEAFLLKASARATLDTRGRLTIASAASDIGTGTYTVMAQIGAGILGLQPEDVSVELGDSRLPAASLEGGSTMATSVGGAVSRAVQGLAQDLKRTALRFPHHPFGNRGPDDLIFQDGLLCDRHDRRRAIALADIVALSGQAGLSCEGSVDPDTEESDANAKNVHSAVFAEVRVDEELGVMRVTRLVLAVAAGHIINPKTARSQILGGAVMGIGMALHEESMFDHRLGRIMNHNLAEYHVPAHADVYDIDVIFVDEAEPEMGPLHAKGVGEIGIVGTAAAIANAIFHATGKRIRDLPITVDKLL